MKMSGELETNIVGLCTVFTLQITEYTALLKRGRIPRLVVTFFRPLIEEI
jgi:hypothetical protein